jgi:hypothetical protein
MAPQPPQPQSPQPAKSNPFGKLLLILIAIVAILFIFQQMGLKTVTHGEDSRVLETNSAEVQNRKMPTRRAAVSSPAVEQTLQDIASELGGPVFSDIRTANTQKGWGLSDDEAKYYDDVRRKNVNTTGSQAGWLNIAKKSWGVYGQVKEIFGGHADVTTAIKDARSALSIYNNIQQTFGISQAESETFAQKARTLSDWASFISAHTKTNN